MAGISNGRIIPLEGAIRTRHRKSIDFRFNGLADVDRTPREYEYNTTCETAPTSWKIELVFEREDGFFFNFSIKLKRMDQSVCSVKASLSTAFCNASGDHILHALECCRDKMNSTDELECLVEEIHPGYIADITVVYVRLEIEKCHGETNLQCASKAIIDNNIKLKGMDHSAYCVKASLSALFCDPIDLHVIYPLKCSRDRMSPNYELEGLVHDIGLEDIADVARVCLRNRTLS